jgi:acyl-coenzyme A thioesterase PaaI-like protein
MEPFQDKIPGNHCFGCGPQNPKGLRIKSYWSGEKTSECRFMPSPHHSAGPLQYLNGGIIATIIDCHCVCTAIAQRYRDEGREVGEGEKIWYVTGALELSYKKPVLLNREVLLKATVAETTEKKTVLKCTLFSQGEACVESSLVAIRVPRDWYA